MLSCFLCMKWHLRTLVIRSCGAASRGVLFVRGFVMKYHDWPLSLRQGDYVSGEYKSIYVCIRAHVSTEHTYTSCERDIAHNHCPLFCILWVYTPRANET